MSLGEPGRHSTIHGTGLMLDGLGILLRGESGAGKSLLALELLDRQRHRGTTGLLVADDRVELIVERGVLMMHAPQAIAGLIELRGRGIVRRPSVAAAPLHLVVDLVDELRRMVEEDELETDLSGITLPRCPVPRRGVVDVAHQLLLVGEALDALGRQPQAARQKTT